MKTLIYDVECTPLLSHTWGTFKQNVIEIDRDWYMISFAYKWLGEKKTHVLALPDYKTYKKNPEDDSELMRALWELVDEADVVIAHNGDAFDIKKMNARFILNGLNKPSFYQTVDTLKVARRYFKFASNKLDNLGEFLGLGRKVQTGGFELWLGCMNGDMKAWKKMCRYNKQDVVLLEKVYLALRPWMDNHPNVGLVDNVSGVCPICGSKELQKRGFAHTRVSVYQRYQCKGCHGWSQSRTVVKHTKVEVK